jgi:hypothetical protein
VISLYDSMSIFSVNQTDADFTADRTVAAPCDGMDRVIIEIAYTGGAPATSPTLEFSMNGVNWDYNETIPAGANPAAGVTLLTLDRQIFSWRFVRVVVGKPQAGGSCRSCIRLLPTIQN